MEPKIELPKSLLEIPSEINFAELHAKRTINLRVKPERPPLAISIGLDDREYKGVHYPLRFATYGNISMIKGEEKSRKSFLKSLIIACAIGGNSNIYSNDIKGHDLQDKYIVDIDTEQGEYDNWMAANRIPEMVGKPHMPFYPENYIAVNLREENPKERRQYLQWLFMESDYRSKLGLVAIDGYVDMLMDFNSQSESSEFTQDLMKFSAASKAHITGILHVNPGQEKGRGHLGTILQQKCETVVIIKDQGQYSEVRCSRVRGSKKFTPFKLEVNDFWLPHETGKITEDWI